QAANPTMLTNGLVSWFKADSITATNGSNLSTWSDQTGNFTAPQNSSANQPTFVGSDTNSEPSVRFNGTQSLYNSGNVSVNMDMTMITVEAPATTSGNYQSLLFLGNQQYPTCRS